MEVLMRRFIAHQRKILCRPKAFTTEDLRLDDAAVLEFFSCARLGRGKRRIKLNRRNHRRRSSKDACISGELVLGRRNGHHAGLLRNAHHRRIQVHRASRQLRDDCLDKFGVPAENVEIHLVGIVGIHVVRSRIGAALNQRRSIAHRLPNIGAVDDLANPQVFRSKADLPQPRIPVVVVEPLVVFGAVMLVFLGKLLKRRARRLRELPIARLLHLPGNQQPQAKSMRLQLDIQLFA